jgi:hypothetical protein
MRLPAVLSLVALASPAGAEPTPPRAPVQDTPHVRVTARIVVVDRQAVTRAGLGYVVVGHDRVRIGSAGRAGGGRGGEARTRGVGVLVGTHGVSAFLEAARARRWIRSETTQRVLTLSGREALVSSTELAVGRRGAARTRGPSLVVVPTALDDGAVRLRVSTRIEDSVTYPWGHGVDGSPAAVETDVVARPGEELILASGSTVERTREAGLLRWSDADAGRDVLVAVSVEVIRR